MTNEKYGPTLPTGNYPVVDHALGAWLLVRPDGRYFSSADSREGTPRPECITGMPTMRITAPRRKYRRSASGFPPPRARRGDPGPPSPDGAARPLSETHLLRRSASLGLRTVLSPGVPPGASPGRPDGGRARPPARKSGLEYPFPVPPDRTVRRQMCPSAAGLAANIGGWHAIPYGIPWRRRTASGNAMPARVGHRIPRNCEKQFRDGREPGRPHA